METQIFRGILERGKFAESTQKEKTDKKESQSEEKQYGIL